jgi:phosphohistidine phosphatase
MRRLMLLRHAKSDWSGPGLGDHERALNRRGRDAAPKIAAYLAEAGLVPDLIVCSTAKRTRQTLQLLEPAFATAPQTRFEERLYLAESKAIVGLVHELPRTVRCAMFVGHNPGMHETALALVGSGDLEQYQRLQSKFPTAALAVIDFPGNDWTDIRPRRGRLERFVTPKLLAEAD